MELKEVFKTELKLEEKKKGGVIGKLYFPWIVTNKENLNKRIYPEHVIKREVGSFNKKIEDSGIAGQLDHPIGVGTRLDKVSHVITKLEYDEKEKKGHAEAQILDTRAGNDLLVVVNQNLKGLGASLRGLGTIDDKTKKVNDDFELKSIDLVLNPSFGKDTAVSAANLIESGNEIFFKKDEKKITVEEFQKQVTIGLGAAFRVDEQAEDLAKFEDENTAKMIEIVKTRYEANDADLSLIFESEEKKEDKDLKERHRQLALYQDAKRAGFQGTLKEWQEQIGNVITEEK